MKVAMLWFLQLLFAGNYVFTQSAPFFEEIRAFARQDSMQFPGLKKILFVGSSSFTLWKDLDTFFPRHSIINRAFGGSTLGDLWRYRELVIFRYAPHQVVMYCGENDFASGQNVPVDTVVFRFQRLFREIRDRLPQVYFLYVSIKPSPARRQWTSTFELANSRIEKYLKGFRRTAFVNVYKDMLTDAGEPDGKWFASDSLHMNDRGYQLWKQRLAPELKRGKK